eukprot:gene11295-18931_t
MQTQANLSQELAFSPHCDRGSNLKPLRRTLLPVRQENYRRSEPSSHFGKLFKICFLKPDACSSK